MAANLDGLMQVMTTTNYAVGSQHWVHVTHINDPSDFYVRLTAYKDYLPVLKAVEGPVDPMKLHIGSMVVYKSPLKKCHMRGQLRDIRANNGTTSYFVFAVDYGCIEAVSIDDMKEPVEKYPFPSLALHCQLSDCQPKDNIRFDSEAIEAMVFYVGKERAKMVVNGITADKYVVQLTNSCPEDIATMMALTGYTCFGYGNNTVSRMPDIQVPRLYYTYKRVKVGDTLKVRVQSGDSLQGFYVCDVEDYKAYTNDLKDLKEYYHRETEFLPENLESGNALAVFADWYARYERAIITEVVTPKEKAVVQLVDLGTKMDVQVGGPNRLKTMSREYYFQRPAMALYCKAEEKQVWDNGLHRFLYPGFEFMITVKEAGHQFETPYVVNISKAGR